MTDSGRGVYYGEMREADTAKPKSILYCSFCGKSQHEVKKLVAGPGVCICNECIELSQVIIYNDNEEAKKKIAHINLWLNRHIKNWQEVNLTGAELLELAFDISLKDSAYGEMSVEEMLVKLEEVISRIIYDKLGLTEIDIEIQQTQEALDNLKNRRENLLLGRVD